MVRKLSDVFLIARWSLKLLYASTVWFGCRAVAAKECVCPCCSCHPGDVVERVVGRELGARLGGGGGQRTRRDEASAGRVGAANITADAQQSRAAAANTETHFGGETALHGATTAWIVNVALSTERFLPMMYRFCRIKRHFCVVCHRCCIEFQYQQLQEENNSLRSGSSVSSSAATSSSQRQLSAPAGGSYTRGANARPASMFEPREQANRALSTATFNKVSVCGSSV